MLTLIIEDDVGYASALRNILWKHRCEMTGSLEIALVWLRHQQFEQVILDLNLNDSDQKQTIDRLPEIRKTSQPAKLVVLTGLLPSHVTNPELADAWLEKTSPDFPDNLFAVLRPDHEIT